MGLEVLNIFLSIKGTRLKKARQVVMWQCALQRQLRGQRGDAPTAGLDLALLKSLAPLTVVSTQRLLLTARQLAQVRG